MAGLAMGIATLIRANTQYIFIVIAPFFLWEFLKSGYKKNIIIGFILFLLSQFLIMLPWAMLQKSAGQNYSTPFPAVYQAYFKGVTRHPGNHVSDWLRDHYKEPQRNMSGVIEFNKEWIKKDPWALFKLYVLKIIRSWYMSDTRRWDKPTLLLHLPYWIFSLAGLTLWIKKMHGDPALAFMGAIIIYMTLISAAMDGIARYSAPLYGFIGTFSGVFFLALKRKLSDNLNGLYQKTG